MMASQAFIMNGIDFYDVRSNFFFFFLVLLKETRTWDESKISSSYFGVNQEN